MMKRVVATAAAIVFLSTLLFAADEPDSKPVSMLYYCQLVASSWIPDRDVQTIFSLCQILEGTDPFPTDSPGSAMLSSSSEPEETSTQEQQASTSTLSPAPDR